MSLSVSGFSSRSELPMAGGGYQSHRNLSFEDQRKELLAGRHSQPLDAFVNPSLSFLWIRPNACSSRWLVVAARIFLPQLMRSDHARNASHGRCCSLPRLAGDRERGRTGDSFRSRCPPDPESPLLSLSRRRGKDRGQPRSATGSNADPWRRQRSGLVAGKPGESLLLQRVISGEMPPRENAFPTRRSPLSQNGSSREH